MAFMRYVLSYLPLSVVLLATKTAAIPSPERQKQCSSSSFQHLHLPLPNVSIKTLMAEPVYNYSRYTPQSGSNPSFNTTWKDLDFCNVTITYTHHGHSDVPIHLTTWLPLTTWNGRFQGTGGAGFVTGLGADDLAPAIGRGYAAAESDGGHTETSGSASWALDEHGEIDWFRMELFAHLALNDLAVLGKAITTAFYGRPPAYSYWNGCSTGGRQGLMLAQRYPEAFDGIVAMSPAIYWPELTVATFWPQLVMNRLGYHPRECELEFVRREATKACDGLDGVVDGIISLPGSCHFDATVLDGKKFECDGETTKLVPELAIIANEIWAGAKTPQGEQLWYGLNHDASFKDHAATTCSNASASSCHGVPFSVGLNQILYLVTKDPSHSLSNISYEAYTSLFTSSVHQYGALLSTTDPDLTAFARRGGKMITTHGLADQDIYPNGTVRYYESVLKRDPRAREYYRFFEAPGVGHCAGGEFYPDDVLGAVVKWVEKGQEPIVLRAGGRELCAFPKVQRFVEGRFGCF